MKHHESNNVLETAVYTSPVQCSSCPDFQQFNTFQQMQEEDDAVLQLELRFRDCGTNSHRWAAGAVVSALSLCREPGHFELQARFMADDTPMVIDLAQAPLRVPPTSAAAIAAATAKEARRAAAAPAHDAQAGSAECDECAACLHRRQPPRPTEDESAVLTAKDRTACDKAARENCVAPITEVIGHLTALLPTVRAHSYNGPAVERRIATLRARAQALAPRAAEPQPAACAASDATAGLQHPRPAEDESTILTAKDRTACAKATRENCAGPILEAIRYLTASLPAVQAHSYNGPAVERRIATLRARAQALAPRAAEPQPAACAASGATAGLQHPRPTEGESTILTAKDRTACAKATRENCAGPILEAIGYLTASLPAAQAHSCNRPAIERRITVLQARARAFEPSLCKPEAAAPAAQLPRDGGNDKSAHEDVGTQEKPAKRFRRCECDICA